jgi:hypothetical protein
MSSQRWAAIVAGAGLGVAVIVAIWVSPAARAPGSTRAAERGDSPGSDPTTPRTANADPAARRPANALSPGAASGAVLHRVAFARRDDKTPMELSPRPALSALAQRPGVLPSCPVSHAGAERHHKGQCAASINEGGVQASVEVNGEMWFDETTGILHLVEGPAVVRNLSGEQRLIVADRSGRLFTVPPMARVDIDAPGPAPPDTPVAVAGDLPPPNNPGMHPTGPIPPGYTPPGERPADMQPNPPPPDYPNPTPGRPLNP